MPPPPCKQALQDDGKKGRVWGRGSSSYCGGGQVKVIFCSGDLSALKDFEKVIQVSELHRRRENNH